MNLLGAVDAQPFVQYRFMLLCDSLRLDLTPLDDLPWDTMRLLAAGPEAVILRSAGNEFYPDVRLEVWAAEPPAPEGEWDEVEEAQFSAPSKVVTLWGPADSLKGELEVPAENLCVRAASRGREAAKEASYDADDEFYGVEEWVVQLWPAA